MSAYTVNSYASLLPDPRGKPSPESDLPRLVWTATKRRNLPGPATDNRYVLADQYIGTQYIAIERVADGLAGAAIQILQRAAGGSSALTSKDARRGKDWTPVESAHPAVRLFEHVNPVDTLIGFLRKYVICRQLFGGVFLYAVPGRSGKPVEIWVVPPQYVLPGIGATAEYPFGSYRLLVPQPQAYGYTQQGLAIVDARQLIFDRKYNPKFEWDALSPLKAGALQIDLLRAINESRKNAVERGLSTRAAVVLEGAGETELTRMKQHLDANHTGTSGDQFILFGGGDGTKITPLDIAPKDMAFEQGYEQLTNFVLSLFAVPHGVAGLTDAGSYAAYYASLQQFHGLKLQPEADEIAAVWTKHLIRPHYGDDYKLVVELKPLVDQDDLKQRYATLLQGGGVTVNEERAAHNLDPLDGGDVPLAVYLQVEQQKAQPQPVAGGLPGLGGDSVGGEQAGNMPGTLGEQDGNTAGTGGEQAGNMDADNPLTAGVLEALGVRGGDGSSAAPGLVRKAWTRFTTQDGGVGAVNEKGDKKYGAEAEAALAAQNNPRHNPDLDEAMGMGSGAKPAPAQQSEPAPTDLRHNPDLDDVFDPKPPAGKGAAAGGVKPAAGQSPAQPAAAPAQPAGNAPAGGGGSSGGSGSPSPAPPLPPTAQPVARRAVQQAKPIAQRLARNPAAVDAANNVQAWADRAAQKHADLIAATHNLDRVTAENLFLHVLAAVVGQIPGVGKAAAVGLGLVAHHRASRASGQVREAATAANQAQKDADAAHKQHAAGAAEHEKNVRRHEASADRLADAGDRLSELRDDHAGHVENLQKAKDELDAATASGDRAKIDAATKKHAAMTERHKRSARQLRRHAKTHRRLAAKHKELTSLVEAGPRGVEGPADRPSTVPGGTVGPRPELAAAMQQARQAQGVLTNGTALGPKRPKVPGSAGSLPPRLKSLAVAYARKVNKSLRQGG